MNEYSEQFDMALDEMADLRRERDALAAVIESARAATKRGNLMTPPWVIEALTASPADALKAHDADLSAAVLGKAIEAVEGERLWASTGRPDDVAYHNAIGDASGAVRDLLTPYRPATERPAQ